MTIATILPEARTVFLDANSNPLSGGSVYMYIPNTTTPKTTWQDAAGATPNSNPIILDGNGSCLLYGSGQYLQEVYDASNNLIYTGLTQDVYGLVISDSGFLNSVAQAPGTTTNDNAATGNLGEYISASNNSGAALTTSTPVNITSISLTAGDWDVRGVFTLGQATSTVVNFYYAGINTISATLPSFFVGSNIPTTVEASSNSVSFEVPTTRISIASTITVYLVAEVSFGTSTATGYGIISARRVR